MAAEPPAKKRRLSSLERQAKELPGFARWNLEQNYLAKRARKSSKDAKHDKLLIKTHDGWKENARHESVQDVRQKASDSLSASDEGDQDSGIAGLEPKPMCTNLTLPAKEQVRQAKENLARIAGHISESPEENIHQLNSLAQLANDENITVKKLAIATQLAVFRDVIPGYRIRPLAKDDIQGKASKEVKRLRAFEQTLLGDYRDYVRLLSQLVQSEDSGVKSVAVTCVCTLVTSVPHFNFRSELVSILVRTICRRTRTSESVKCLTALEQLFREDEEGHVSLEAVSQLTKEMKAKNYQIHETVLDTFLHLRLLSEFAHKASTIAIDKSDAGKAHREKLAKSKREFRTKRERKALRERKAVEKEMKEADAAVSYEDRDKNQAETLKLVFVAYFRILKDRTRHLQGAVLEGLAKYSHLINQDFFGDILEVLRDLIKDSSLPSDDADESTLDESDSQRSLTREALLCINTAFALLQGQHDVVKSASGLHLDLNFFITHLWRCLIPLSMNADPELSAKTPHLRGPDDLSATSARHMRVNVATTSVLFLRALHAALLPAFAAKAVSPVRVVAFAKQLMTLSLHLPPKSAKATLALMKDVMKVHSGKVAALWHTEERKGDGVFNALSEEVESSNPFAATCWEGELLRVHFDPGVREEVTEVEKRAKEARKG